MSGFYQDTQNYTGTGTNSGTILRDYQHADRIFRPDGYANAPKLKFLFHTYFELNVPVDGIDFLGTIVKEVKLPAYTFNTYQMNQYNRKRIVQTKIKYDPVDITFHDDNNNVSTKVWETYYKYYFNDAQKIGTVISGPGQTIQQQDATNYNKRNIYDENLSTSMDWGYLGGSANTSLKPAFFKNITVFGFNQHKFTAYTLINPIITNFSHDTYNYSESGGTMSNRMSIDYETVVYTYGSMDGRTPGNVVKGFGDPSHYDNTPSPIAGTGQGTALGQGGLVDAAGGSVETDPYNSNSFNAQNSVYANASRKISPNDNINIGKQALGVLQQTSASTAPINRNALFSIPTAQSAPGPRGLAGSPTIDAQQNPAIVTETYTTSTLQFAGTQI